jgi:heterodisulfide reductase subunit B
MPIEIKTDLAHNIQEECGENVYLCYQCKKCTAGCPVAEHFDLTPNQLLRAAQFGQKDLILNSKTIWLCALCETCATRCPQGINITAIMDVFRIMAWREGIAPKVPTVPEFYKATLREINLLGRMYEPGLMGELYVRQFLRGELDFKLFAEDMGIAFKMFRIGKLSPIPSRGKPPKKGPVASAVTDPQTIAYYPGCSLHGASREYHVSTLAVMRALGWTLQEPKNWCCCGTTPAHSIDPVLAAVLPMRTLAQMEREGHSYMTFPCPSCFQRFQAAIQNVSQDEELAGEVRAQTDYLPSRDLKMDHLLTTITERIGCEAVAKKVTRPLENLKVVCYYGCALTRPPRLTGVEDYEYPTDMDRLVETVGAESLDWSYKTECCGGSLGLTQLPTALEMSCKVLHGAKAVGAEAIVVACPLCHINLDTRQKQIEKEYGEAFNLPIIYFTQLMGIAFGLNAKTVGLDKHLVDPVSFLAEKSLLST